MQLTKLGLKAAPVLRLLGGLLCEILGGCGCCSVDQLDLLLRESHGGDLRVGDWCPTSMTWILLLRQFLIGLSFPSSEGMYVYV